MGLSSTNGVSWWSEAPTTAMAMVPQRPTAAPAASHSRRGTGLVIMAFVLLCVRDGPRVQLRYGPRQDSDGSVWRTGEGRVTGQRDESGPCGGGVVAA